MFTHLQNKEECVWDNWDKKRQKRLYTIQEEKSTGDKTRSVSEQTGPFRVFYELRGLFPTERWNKNWLRKGVFPMGG